MSRHRNQTKKSKLRELPPPQKAASKNSRTRTSKSIRVDAKHRKTYTSILQLLKRDLQDAPAALMPADLKPMLATLADEPFTDSAWQFELKMDGYRTLAYLQNGNVELRSRNNNSFNIKFDGILSALQQWNINAVVDGEIVVLNDEGVPDFNSIQQWEKNKKGQLVFYVFDLIWLDGLDLTREPLYRRREVLRQLMPESGTIRYSDHIDDIGEEFFAIAKKNNLEGIIAKKKDSLYIPDSRAKTWLKIKIEERHEAIICGYTRKRDSDRVFSSLLLGIYEDGELQFLGQTGTGFTASGQTELLKKMNAYKIKECPFETIPPIGNNPVWLNPALVCEVKYTELTDEGVMRHASFQGLREDKTAADLNTVVKRSSKELVEECGDHPEVISAAEKDTIVTIDGHDLKLTNLKKIYWPKEKITKGDMLRYYHQMSDYILPYMMDRPQSLNRFPNGVGGESFYHKDMGGKVDPWVKTFQRFSESTGEPKDFMICTNTASLVYMANLGCIEMNPWHSRTASPLYPDWSVIDLDPGDISFEKVIETALVVKSVLDALQVPSYPKTSGSTGLHIYIPLGAKYNYEQSKQLAELVANLVHEELPSFTSLVRNPAKRTDKIYIDYLQNRPIQTICAPYSIRPKPGATVSAPLRWDEVKTGLTISQFNMKTIGERVRSEGDLFSGVMGKGIDLNKVLKSLTNLI